MSDRKKKSKQKGDLNEYITRKTLEYKYPFDEKNKKGIKWIRDSSGKEDWDDHWDHLYHILKDDKYSKGDCKSQASVGSGYNKIYLENELWGEHQAVFKQHIFENGKYIGVDPNYINGTSEIREGSMYGEADFFTYRFPEHIFLVLAEPIRKLLKDKVDTSEEILEYRTTPDPSKYLYKIYGRLDFEYKEDFQNGLINNEVQRGDRLFLYSLSDLSQCNDYWKINIPLDKLPTWEDEFKKLLDK